MAEDEAVATKPAPDSESICKQADQLYADNKWRKTLEYLQQFSETEDPELLWRLIRVNYRIGKQGTSDHQEAKTFAEAALQFSEKALALHGNDFQCVKWTGINLSWASEVVGGNKMKIEKSYEVRDHWKKAAELKPDDASVKHLLGRWCFQIASVPWYQRKAASWILATPPTSSYEEALPYFEAAEKAEPGFYCTNWLYLGKTHLKLGHKEEARQWLQKTLEFQATQPDDEEAQTEARTLLKKL